MELSPRYGSDPLITLDGRPGEIAVPTLRQRRRLAASVATFGPGDWAAPSRCAGWTGRDVIAHLDSTNAFWVHSIASGRRGSPSTVLSGFDPVRTPAALVESTADLSAGEVFERFTASNDALIALVESLGDDEWSLTGEAPPGHQSLSAVAHHALWDSWVHERDILLPLGIEPVEEPDEVAACLRYVASLGPALAAVAGSRTGTLVVEATEPDVAFTVEVGESVRCVAGTSPAADLRLTGRAADLVEMLSIRRPFDPPLPEEGAWLVRGLADVFDAGPA